MIELTQTKAAAPVVALSLLVLDDGHADLLCSSVALNMLSCLKFAVCLITADSDMLTFTAVGAMKGGTGERLLLGFTPIVSCRPGRKSTHTNTARVTPRARRFRSSMCCSVSCSASGRLPSFRWKVGWTDQSISMGWYTWYQSLKRRRRRVVKICHILRLVGGFEVK